MNILISIRLLISNHCKIQFFDKSGLNRHIRNDRCYLIQLTKLCLNNNYITYLPLEIINLINLTNFTYYNNPIENLLNPIINRFINRINNKHENNSLIILYDLCDDTEENFITFHNNFNRHIIASDDNLSNIFLFKE